MHAEFWNMHFDVNASNSYALQPFILCYAPEALLHVGEFHLPKASENIDKFCVLHKRLRDRVLRAENKKRACFL